MKITSLPRMVPTMDLRVVQPTEKQADPHYSTPEHFAWRAVVLKRAGFRCEAVVDGRRCERSKQNGDQIYADHIREIKDGGAKLDPANGQALCASCHTLKTHAERDLRFSANPRTSPAV